MERVDFGKQSSLRSSHPVTLRTVLIPLPYMSYKSARSTDRFLAEEKMPRNKDGLPAVRVYTVCEESRYLIVRNVPALGCGDELLKLFGSYGEIEECKPMDGEDCEPYTDVYWIKFLQVSNARFAKRKLDDSVFFGNRLQVSYAPHFESLSDTKDKLEGRRKEVLSRINSGTSKGSKHPSLNCLDNLDISVGPLPSELSSRKNLLPRPMHWRQLVYAESAKAHRREDPIGDSIFSRVTSNKEYFSSPSMNNTVQLVREKLDKIQSSSDHAEVSPALKKPRVDNRRRI